MTSAQLAVHAMIAAPAQAACDMGIDDTQRGVGRARRPSE